MNYSIGSGIIRYIKASKTFSKFRALRNSVRFEVPCASKFRAFRSSVRLEVPCGHRVIRVGGEDEELPKESFRLDSQMINWSLILLMLIFLFTEASYQWSTLSNSIFYISIV